MFYIDLFHQFRPASNRGENYNRNRSQFCSSSLEDVTCLDNTTHHCSAHLQVLDAVNHVRQIHFLERRMFS